VEAVVMNYYRHINRECVQFDFLVDSDSTDIPRDEIERLGGTIIEVPPYQNVISYQKQMYLLFQSFQWRIVHSHVNTLSVLPLRAAELAGVPVRIAHSHSTSGQGEHAKNAIKGVLRLFANTYPTHRFACSTHAGEWLFGKKADFDIIYNAIELDKFKFDARLREEARAALGLTESQFVIGHIGRFMPQKNHEFLIRVFSGLCNLRSDCILLLVGDGALKHQIEKMAVDYGISNKVIFLGQRDDVSWIYQALDAFMLPSLYEGLGIVAIEAQTNGLPCYVSSCVPVESNITGTCEYLSIDSPKQWIERLATVRNTIGGRRFKVKMSDLKNYDILEQSKLLTKKYQQLYEKYANG
jgi:glycosyltransferase EpsF